jgi:hypothetical protein
MTFTSPHFKLCLLYTHPSSRNGCSFEGSGVSLLLSTTFKVFIANQLYEALQSQVSSEIQRDLSQSDPR